MKIYSHFSVHGVRSQTFLALRYLENRWSQLVCRRLIIIMSKAFTSENSVQSILISWKLRLRWKRPNQIFEIKTAHFDEAINYYSVNECEMNSFLPMILHWRWYCCLMRLLLLFNLPLGVLWNFILAALCGVLIYRPTVSSERRSLGGTGSGMLDGWSQEMGLNRHIIVAQRDSTPQQTLKKISWRLWRPLSRLVGSCTISQKSN